MGEQPGDVPVGEQTDPRSQQSFGGGVDFTTPELAEGGHEIRLVLSHDPPQFHGLESGVRPCLRVKRPIVSELRVDADRWQL